jgi:nucleolar protein 56
VKNIKMTQPLYVLFESSLGFSLFERTRVDEVGLATPEMQESLNDYGLFMKMVRLVNFKGFENSTIALECMNELVAGECPSLLVDFLKENLPLSSSSSKKKSKFVLGVLDKSLASSIKSALDVECVSDDLVFELIRGIRQHSCKFLTNVLQSSPEEVSIFQSKSQLGLGHGFSRSKVKFNVHRSDNMVIQAICLLDQLDKDINTFAMRVKEWYGWHFPELAKILSVDVAQYARCVLAIGDKSTLTGPDSIEAALGDDGASFAKQIFEASKTSMGTDISPLDLINIKRFADRVVSLASYRNELSEYLCTKMKIVAPNLTELIGQVVGARLISHAGSLSNLAKYPASTVQILGAEKALFRSLKKKDGKTPKFGLLFHSAPIGKASGTKNKGRISRYLANKCSLASRIDCFSESTSSTPAIFGDALRKQVEQRIDFLDTGKAPERNIDVMHSATKKLKKLSKAVTA